MAVLFRGWFLAMALCAAGCIIRSGPGPNDPSGGSPAIVVQNRSSGSICIVKFSPSSDNSWGADRLGSEQIAAGSSHTWPVSAGEYDVRFETCAGQVLAERRRVAVNGPTEVSYP